MNKKMIPGITLIVLITVTMIMTFNPTVVMAQEPPIEILSDYTLERDIKFADSGFLIKANNITLDLNGHTITGSGKGYGLSMESVRGVTIKNGVINFFEEGIHLRDSKNNTITGNTITSNSLEGIWIGYDSCNNTISLNTISENSNPGIHVMYSSNNNTVSGNMLAYNFHGITFHTCTNNHVIGNTISYSLQGGIVLADSCNNTIETNTLLDNSHRGIEIAYNSNSNLIFHNKFINNEQQALAHESYNNAWDDGYPSGGNYWSDYTGVDEKSGPNQDQPGSDGIGDTPYPIYVGDQDRYPLMIPAYPVHNIDTGLDYATIQEAIDDPATSDGHTVHVDAGTYHELITIHKSISLTGEDSKTTIIDGGHTGTVANITTNNVKITGLTIQNSGEAHPYRFGIYVSEESTGNNISYNIITNNHIGIQLEQTSYNSIYGNNMTNNDYGIFPYGSSHNSISENNITNSGYGIRLDRSSHNNISDNNITDGTGYGIYLSQSSNNALSTNNVIDNYGDGVYLWYSSYNSISGNNITNNDAWGISISNSFENTISGNIITDNEFGFELSECHEHVLSGNMINGSRYNFAVDGRELPYFLHTIDASNLLNGKSVRYLVNQKDLTINPATHPQVGYLALIQCTNVTVEGLTITNNTQGLLLCSTNNSRIRDNNLNSNYYGLWLLSFSNSNTIYRNNFTSNECGVWLLDSNYNKFYHNNFIRNYFQVSSYFLDNIWDDGYPSGGNRWSDYTGEDWYSGPYQNETGRDGIGDTPYVTDAHTHAQDNYPLMPLWFPVRNIDTNRNYTTIQAAIDAPATFDGHTIQVDSGVYTPVTIYKSISLIGENRDTTIIDGRGEGTVVTISADGVTITGFTIQNCGGFILHSCVEVRSNGNKITYNTMTATLEYGKGRSGVLLWESSNNILIGNTLSNNYVGILLLISENNTIYHNNFINFADPVFLEGAYNNTWDDGCEGNYWSIYTGKDEYHGKYQNKTGSDGIGDTPYVIDEDNQDNCPFMERWYINQDINNDGIVNIVDVSIAAAAFGSYPGHERWNCRADIDRNHVVNIIDVATVALKYGWAAD